MRKGRPKTKDKRLKGLGPRGWYRIGCGYVKVPGVEKLRVPRWYTSPIPSEHEAKSQVIKMRWATLKLAGHKYWPQSEIDKLIEDELIRGNGEVNAAVALARLTSEVKEPLEQTELAPFLDADGQLTPQAAVAANDLMLRKVFTRMDVRSAFFRQMLKDALSNPKEAFEWCVRNMGWTKEKTASFLFNVEGNMTVDPIAFDASAEPVKPIQGVKTDTAEKLIDVVGEIGDVTDRDS